MAIIFDPPESAKNVTERGLSFAWVAELDWDRAIMDEDMRKDYGDLRLLILAPLNGRLHAWWQRHGGESARDKLP